MVKRSDRDRSEIIFSQPWWLDAVAPGKWNEIVLKKNDQTVARFPYVLQKKWGFTFISMPPLTQNLGPWLKLSSNKYANRLAEEKELLFELISKLPKFDMFRQRFHFTFTNWLPFYWKNFQQTTRYTYIIESLADQDFVWNSFRENARREIRKAKKRVEIRDDLGIDSFLNLNELTFQRQGKKLPYSRDLVLRLDKACQNHNSRKILFAEDAQGHIHAGAYFVWDEKCTYYIMGGMDPEWRNSGAMSLLMWEGIKCASQHSEQFDFEGSMIEPIERFVRSFGAVQKPFFNILKINSTLLYAANEINMWKQRKKS